MSGAAVHSWDACVASGVLPCSFQLCLKVRGWGQDQMMGNVLGEVGFFPVGGDMDI